MQPSLRRDRPSTLPRGHAWNGHTTADQRARRLTQALGPRPTKSGSPVPASKGCASSCAGDFVLKLNATTAGALLAIALCGCGGDDENDPPNTGGKGGSATGGAGGAGASSGGSATGGTAGVSGGGAGGSSAGAGSGGQSGGPSGGGGSGGTGATGCMRVPSSDATCADNFPDAPRAHSCADLRSGFDLDDAHDNTCWNTNVVPGGAIGYCCPAK
jgi:hypothetical protein